MRARQCNISTTDVEMADGGHNMALLKPVGGIGKKMTLDGKFGHTITSKRS
ncbi:hypothetical protein Fmac_018219 [Flemingia macrophylla]|uniref:Uncharacterized protein n=1 Tax=Flemingia macrophylla TaxID=520843 RepID=A0ABD1M4C0_9FABA